MEKEDGEMSDDNAMVVDDIKEEFTAKQHANHTVLYKAAKNGLIIETLEKIDATKLEERAKRFGLNLSGNRVVTQTQIDELYTKSGIESGNERHFRFDTLHLNGVDGLTTRDIFEYLEDYKPVSLEIIDDVSCNIVCQDHISAALALLVHSREIRNEQLKEMISEKSQYHWREGMPHPKKDLILMRFATNGDKKVSKKKTERPQHSDEYYDQSMDPISKNPWGDLCKSWGVYDHQEVFQRKLPKNDYEDDIEEPVEVIQVKNKRLAMRLGKRSHNVDYSEDSNSDSEWKKKTKTPRMRMHADDEESKQKKKRHLKQISEDEDSYDDTDKADKYAPLSIEVVNSRSSYTPRETTKLSDKFKSRTDKSETSTKRVNVLSRLGVKVTPAGRSWSDDASSDESDHNVSSRVQKVKSMAKSTSSVWSRLETKESSHNDLRQVLKSRKDKKPDDIRLRPDDLRDRIRKSKKTNLRIEIDND
ncbi:nuclear cap-binding protein subunit 3-like [Pectinophora gossypiella]|uniref:Nuclear cap-binding protein subunit 3 n=2 Tax=Pectinophora gossypiella TaxID=13191 RepID=A0A1E1WUZ7_PECGO|nr:nuclear cap-binding protein subunit 3-like [Pectinophora gossypiella]